MADGRKAAKKSPTARSLEYLRKNGYIPGVVEQWLTFPERDKFTRQLTGKTIRTKRDLFNFVDIVAIHEGMKGTLFVQTTSRANQSARIKKALESPALIPILRAGNTVHIHGWAQVGARGDRKTWKVSVHNLGFVNGSMTPVLLDEAYTESEGVAEPSLFSTPAELPGANDDEALI